MNRVGWSVVVRGRLHEVVDPDELARLDALEVSPFAPGEGRRHLVRLEPRAITGHVTPLPDDLPEGWFRSAILGTNAIR